MYFFPLSQGTNEANLSEQCLQVTAFNSHWLLSANTVCARTVKLTILGFKWLRPVCKLFQSLTLVFLFLADLPIDNHRLLTSCLFLKMWELNSVVSLSPVKGCPYRHSVWLGSGPKGINNYILLAEGRYQGDQMHSFHVNFLNHRFFVVPFLG